jgi:hypothetical protein
MNKSLQGESKKRSLAPRSEPSYDASDIQKPASKNKTAASISANVPDCSRPYSLFGSRCIFCALSYLNLFLLSSRYLRGLLEQGSRGPTRSDRLERSDSSYQRQILLYFSIVVTTPFPFLLRIH